MAVSPLLRNFIDDELGRAPDLIARTTAQLVEQLRQPKDQLLASERQHHFDLVDVLQRRAGDFQRSFVDALRERVLEELEPAPDTGPSSGPSTLGGLQLMDEGRVEADIEISRAVQQIDSGTEWELRELQTFTSTLRGQTHTTAESNPLRPLAYARALWAAAGTITPVPVQQAILLRIASTVMTGLLRMAWAAACSRLESQGVEPSLYRTVVFAPGAGAARKPQVDVTMPGALEGLVRSMPSGDPGPAVAPPAPGGRGAALGPALEQALARIEALLARLPEKAPRDDAGAREGVPSARLSEFRGTLLSAADETLERQIIELLSRLFETILGDPMLPQPLRTLLGRLQVSALRIALRDPRMMEVHEHPVWQLMDRIAGAAAAWPLPGDPRLARLLGHPGALLQHRVGEAHDPLDPGAGGLGDLLGGLAGADPRLDVTGAQGAFHLHLQLAESGMVAPEGRAEPVVDGYGELLTGVADEDQALAVLAQPHRGEVLHRCRLLRSAWCEPTSVRPCLGS